MAKENQRVVLSKRMLKEGLMALLKNKNIREISVNELCETAEINRTTFYRHYQTPHDVLIDIELDFAKLAQEKPLPSTARGDIKKHALYLCEFLDKHRDTMKLFLQNSADNDVAVIYQRYFDLSLASRQLLYKGRPVSPEILQLRNTFFAYGIYAVIRQWILEDMPLTPEEVADLFAGSFNQDFSFSDKIIGEFRLSL